MQNLPAEGPVVVVANHASTLDPLALGVACPRAVYFMAKEELFRNPVSAFFLRALHAFPVVRGQADREAYRMSMEVLKNGCVLGIFPEGTRSKTGGLLRAHPGAARFSLQTGSPVVPAAVVGTFPGHRKGVNRFRTPGVRVIFGEPIDPSVFTGGEKATREMTDAFAHEIMGRVEQLMSVLLLEGSERNSTGSV